MKTSCFNCSISSATIHSGPIFRTAASAANINVKNVNVNVKIYVRFVWGCKCWGQEGPYSICRNPLYLFSGLGGLGVVIISERLILVIFFLLVFCANFFLIVRFEEKRLRLLFGAEYESYAARVPRLIPRFRNYLPSGRLEVDSQRILLGIAKSMRFFGMAFAVKLIEVLKEFYR